MGMLFSQRNRAAAVIYKPHNSDTHSVIPHIPKLMAAIRNRCDDLEKHPLSGVRPPPCLSGRTRAVLVFGCNWTEGLDWVTPHYRCVLIAMTAVGNKPLLLSEGRGCAVFLCCTSGAFFPLHPVLLSVFSACKSVLFSYYGEEVQRFGSFPCSFFERMQMIIACRPSPPHIHFPFFISSVFPSSRSWNRREQ